MSLTYTPAWLLLPEKENNMEDITNVPVTPEVPAETLPEVVHTQPVEDQPVPPQ